MSSPGKVRAYLELARISNVPTVVSNALAGAAIVAYANDQPGNVPWRPTLAAAAACAMFYIAGMAMNDLVDRSTDQLERPSRPIPSGRVSVEGALVFLSTLLIGGWLILLAVGREAAIAGLLLILLIVLYNLLHGRTWLSVFLMGACRGMALVTGGLALGVPERTGLLALPALTLTTYVAVFSIVARREAETVASEAAPTCPSCGHDVRSSGPRCPECGADRSGARRRLRFPFMQGLSLLLIAPAVAIPIQMAASRPRSLAEVSLLLAVFMLAGFLHAWIAAAARLIELRPPRIGAAVTMWIAAISLSDALIAVLSRAYLICIACLLCFGLTRLAQRRIAGT